MSAASAVWVVRVEVWRRTGRREAALPLVGRETRLAVDLEPVQQRGNAGFSAVSHPFLIRFSRRSGLRNGRETAWSEELGELALVCVTGAYVEVTRSRHGARGAAG